MKTEAMGVPHLLPHLQWGLLRGLFVVMFGESPVQSLLATDLATAIQVQKRTVLVKKFRQVAKLKKTLGKTAALPLTH